MRYSIVSGSHRLAGNSHRVADLVSKTLVEMGGDVHHLNLSRDPLPFWNDEYTPEEEAKLKVWSGHEERLKASQALVIISPEWNGMAAPALRNFFLFCKAGAVGHKPALLVTVSFALGGSYPVQELRGSSYKNNFMCYLPEHVLIRNVESFLERPEEERSRRSRERLEYSLKVLKVYGEAFVGIRESGVLNLQHFGM